MCGPSSWGYGPLGSAVWPPTTSAAVDSRFPRKILSSSSSSKEAEGKSAEREGNHLSKEGKSPQKRGKRERICSYSVKGDYHLPLEGTSCVLREFPCPLKRKETTAAACLNNNLWDTDYSWNNNNNSYNFFGKCQQQQQQQGPERRGGATAAPFPFHLVLTAALVFLVASLQPASAGLVLSDHILHFEPVFYDETHFRSQHHRAKRDANHIVRLHFTAHNRLFKLRLRRDDSIFADDVVFETSDGPIDFDFSKVYTGTLEDDHLAQVEGVVTKEGLFDGHVATPNELYYLEPAHRYLDGAEFHSVMYKASDVVHPSLSRCSSQQLHLRGHVHTPWGPPPPKSLYETKSLGSHYEPLGVPTGPERFLKERREEENSGLSGTSAPSTHSSISSSAAPPSRADAVPSPKPQGVNPKHKAVTRSKSFYDAASDNVKLSGLSGASTSTSTSSSSSSSSPSLSDALPEISSSSPSPRLCNEESSCRRSYTSTKKSTFDNKPSHFVKQFKQHFQHSANLQSPAGAQSNAHPSQHSDSINYNYNYNMASLHNSSSALDSDSRHVDFELVYEPTGGKDAGFSRPSWNYTRKTGVRPPALPEFGHAWPKRSVRKKRSSVDPQKTTCMLYLQADHLFYERIGSEEACIDTITRHVQRVNNIYKVTDFNSDKAADEIGFMIKRIKIHTPNALNDPVYRFPGNYGVEKFLELFSEEDYDAFCLAYMFTYRDFEGGTLGLAWTGDLKNAGGVCEKNGHYRGSLKSLNTGIVTLLNYGKHVPPAVSHVTLAHEIGHNFGSPHDPESDTRCTPGGPDGNYIMYARATSGDKQNNNKFSPCSLRQINSVLNSKARDSKGCFTQPQAAICGNGVVEAGEECDCGWEEDCEEACCYPMKTNPKRGQTPCTLRPNKICSPSQGPCCTNNCHLKQRDKCRNDNGCRDASYCNGRVPQCPESNNKPNKTICNEEFVCYKGECSGSICLAYGLESCQCSRNRGDPITKSCELCCKLPGEDQSCLSSFEWNVAPFDIPDMYAKAGTPCNDYKGYCDVFKKCREVDPSGPLATLRGLLLSDESLANLQRWIVEHWYAVLFVIFAVMVLLVAIIKVFGKTPETKTMKSKKTTIRHKNDGTTQYTLPATGATANGTTDVTTNHVVHPTVVRANLPFKRKVNEVRRAATKAKRAAKSQLSRPTKKSSRRPDGGVISPTESEKSGPGITEGTTAAPHGTRVKERISSRFSIISFKTFRPKSLSPDKHKGKSPDKRKSKSGNDKKSKVKNSKNHHRSHSPDKKRRSEGRPAESPDKHRRSRSPNKRSSLEDDRRKSRNHSVSPDKVRRSSPDKVQRHRARSPDKHRKMSEGNWLINKFLADEEKTAKPIVNGSLVGSLNGSISSVSAVLGGPTSSPQIGPVRNGSTRGLLSSDSNRASPLRGFINEAFISSPRGARTHSSLRVTKSVSPEGLDFDFGPNKYRRSISMEAYNKPPVSPDKRKRSVLDEGLSPDKRRKFSSPEKTHRGHSPPKEHRFSHPSKTHHIVEMEKRHSKSPPLSKPSSYSSVPERLREKLSLITASPSGSIASILPPSEPADTVSLHSSSHSTHSNRGHPKDWV